MRSRCGGDGSPTWLSFRPFCSAPRGCVSTKSGTLTCRRRHAAQMLLLAAQLPGVAEGGVETVERGLPTAVERIGQKDPALAPAPGVRRSQPSAFFGRDADAGQEVAQIVADQQKDAIARGNGGAARAFVTVPFGLLA